MEIVTHEAVGHTLFDPDALINHNDGEVISLTSKGIRGHYTLHIIFIIIIFHKVPLTHDEFNQMMKTFRPPVLPAKTVTVSMMKQCQANIENTHDERFGIPTLLHMGFKG